MLYLFIQITILVSLLKKNNNIILNFRPLIDNNFYIHLIIILKDKKNFLNFSR